jgi:hypothetical protein
VRAKNILSVLMQVIVAFLADRRSCGCVYGDLARRSPSGGAFIGGTRTARSSNGVCDPAAGTFALAATFSQDACSIPRVSLFAAFQAHLRRRSPARWSWAPSPSA